ncbi:MAG: response regulator [Patescibacteria group bacterium]|nr:response regulator [Patescibacteria group bacterium]
MKKVLVLEDRDIDFWKIEQAFAGKADIVRASNQWEFKKLFEENPDLDLVMMDYFSPGDTPNTLLLLQEIKKSVSDMPIISSSMMYFRRKEMLDAGATHEGEKEKAVDIALNLLGL